MTPSKPWLQPTALLGMGVLIPIAAVCMAWVSQHQFDMMPCPWCVLQRLIFLCIAAPCVLALLWRQALWQRTMAALATLLALSGVGTALWQHFIAAKSASCNLTMADRIVQFTGLETRWPELFEPRASCADAAVSLWGMPYEFWSLGLFALLALALGGMALGLVKHKAV